MQSLPPPAFGFLPAFIPLNTKYGPVKTDHILFIGAGAFHVAKPTDLIPELQGRFPIRVELENLDEEAFYMVLTVPENALLKQHRMLLETEGTKVNFIDDAAKKISKMAFGRTRTPRRTVSCTLTPDR